MGRLEVTIIEARNLPTVKIHGTPDPYVVVKFEGQTHDTQTIHETVNPTWNELMHFNVANPEGDMLNFEVRCKRTLKDSSLGRFSMSIAGLIQGETRDEWVVLDQGKKGLFGIDPLKHKTSGELHFTVRALDFGLVSGVTAAAEKTLGADQRGAAWDASKIESQHQQSQEHISLDQAVNQQFIPMQKSAEVFVPVVEIPAVQVVEEQPRKTTVTTETVFKAPQQELIRDLPIPVHRQAPRNAETITPMSVANAAPADPLQVSAPADAAQTHLVDIQPVFPQQQSTLPMRTQEVDKSEVTKVHHKNSDKVVIKQEQIKYPEGQLPQKETDITTMKFKHGTLLHPNQETVQIKQTQTVYPEGKV